MLDPVAWIPSKLLMGDALSRDSYISSFKNDLISLMKKIDRIETPNKLG